MDQQPGFFSAQKIVEDKRGTYQDAALTSTEFRKELGSSASLPYLNE